MELILISNDFWHKIKIYNFDPYNVLLAIATNIPLMTASVLQGHIYSFIRDVQLTFGLYSLFILFKCIINNVTYVNVFSWIEI